MIKNQLIVKDSKHSQKTNEETKGTKDTELEQSYENTPQEVQKLEFGKESGTIVTFSDVLSDGDHSIKHTNRESKAIVSNTVVEKFKITAIESSSDGADKV